jgi:hypothetical protein
VQQIELLAGQRRDQQADAGDIAAGPVEARNQAVSDRIGGADKYDGSCSRCGLRRFCRIGAAGGEEDVDLSSEQIGHQLWQTLVMTFSEAVFDRDVLVFDVAGFL